MVNFKEVSEFVGQEVNLCPFTNAYRIVLKLRGKNDPLCRSFYEDETTVKRQHHMIGQIMVKYKSFIRDLANAQNEHVPEMFNKENLQKFLETI